MMSRIKYISSLKNSKIKKEYITASSPQKTIHYKQFFIQKKLITVENFRKFIYRNIIYY